MTRQVWHSTIRTAEGLTSRTGNSKESTRGFRIPIGLTISPKHLPVYCQEDITLEKTQTRPRTLAHVHKHTHTLTPPNPLCGVNKVQAGQRDAFALFRFVQFGWIGAFHLDRILLDWVAITSPGCPFLLIFFFTLFSASAATASIGELQKFL